MSRGHCILEIQDSGNTRSEVPGRGFADVTGLPKILARSGDRAQCSEAKGAAARAGGVTSCGSNFIRGPNIF